MKERTISQRNLLGAFVGGMVGILTFGYFNNIALMVAACFSGVIGGWWYQELFRYTADGFNSGVMLTKQVGAFMFTPIRKLGEWRDEMKRNIDSLDLFYYVAILMIPFIWLLRRPVAIVMWARAHPVNRAYLVRAATLPVFYAVNVVVIGLLAFLLYDVSYGIDLNRDLRGLPIIFGGLILFGISFASLAAPIGFWSIDSGGQLDKMCDFYRVWERYSSMGLGRFYVAELMHMMRYWFSAVTLLVASIAWFCGVGGIFLVIVAVFSAVVGFVKGVYQVSTQAGHWLCFGVTLTVTAIAAWIGHGQFGDVRVLWSMALMAGVVSALATEGIRRLIVWAFRTSRSARAVALMPLGKQLRPGGRVFMQTTEQIGDWFVGLLPMNPQQI